MTEQQEIINITTLEEAQNLMGERFGTMVQYFLEDTQMYFQEIERGVKENNAELAVAPSHTIKSSAKQLGADRVSAIAELIEELCRNMIESKNSDIPQLQQLTDELKKEIDAATPELNKFCK